MDDKWRDRSRLGEEVGFLKGSAFRMLQEDISKPFLNQEERAILRVISDQITGSMDEKTLIDFLEQGNNCLSDIATKYNSLLLPKKNRG